MTAKFFHWRLLHLFKFLKSILLTARSILFVLSYPKTVEVIFNEGLIPFKREVFADIGSIIPSNKNGKIRILEAGIGPGYNLEFYPKNCRLIALDKNPHFKKLLLQNLQKVRTSSSSHKNNQLINQLIECENQQHPHIKLERFVNERAEKMASIPSNSVDVVISSHLHCSVDNSQSVLSEIRRILVPVSQFN